MGQLNNRRYRQASADIAFDSSINGAVFDSHQLGRSGGRRIDGCDLTTEGAGSRSFQTPGQPPDVVGEALRFAERRAQFVRVLMAGA